MRHALMLLLAGAVLGGNGCAPRHAPSVTPAPASTASTVPRSVRKDLLWFRASAEYRGLAREVYRSATEHLGELAAGKAKGTWAVILDADETILDNSLNERRLADRGETYSEKQWAVWVREKAATAIPGAVDFATAVHAKGGRIVVVTNRADSLCAPTRDNIRSVGIVADVVLCQTGPSDKNPRFAMVESGHAAADVPALQVVAWVGDNIQDFPKLTQAVRDTPNGYIEFGHRYFLLPNPMYGSWEKLVEP
jgi:5'-nucleotidase (lipoprotein e(P4) family)